ncbi:MAG: hypothetical protein ACLR76_04390 [Alistipes sp.]
MGKGAVGKEGDFERFPHDSSVGRGVTLQDGALGGVRRIRS